MASTTPFITAIAERRSVYALSNEAPISNERILELVTEALKHAPSPFNVRSCRAVVLFGDEHTALWEEAYRVTEATTPAAISILGPKIKAFGDAKGTVVFLDDPAAYKLLTPRFQAHSALYPEWEEHSSGMNQLIVWTALAAEGVGANLQHYQPGITPFLQERYGVSKEWKVKAQLVFGGIVGEVPGPKPKTHLEESLKVFGS
ncbi:Nitroreductase [Bimuria novae-zelandiae CBS 107.79]|uniref:Nitroreductase n=1 Tax=Bimuria novae-zelandiae CBS 107.79 TaxID=1447943 RepID=A0A6A5VD19_9PLEO|nr:Nitroreductase [Bimuria novae-zelandiae CBS 107.79]